MKTKLPVSKEVKKIVSIEEKKNKKDEGQNLGNNNKNIPPSTNSVAKDLQSSAMKTSIETEEKPKQNKIKKAKSKK